MNPQDITEKDLADKFLAIVGAVPVIGNIITVAGAYSHVVGIQKRDRLFHRLQWFFQEYDKTQPEDRDKFEKELGGDKEKFYRDLLIVVDDIDSDEQVRMLLTLFANLISGKIPMHIFKRVSNVIRKVYVDDLLYLRDNKTLAFVEVHKLKRQEQLCIPILESFGLVSTVQTTTSVQHGTTRTVNERYSITLLGQYLVWFAFEMNPPQEAMDRMNLEGEFEETQRG